MPPSQSRSILLPLTPRQALGAPGMARWHALLVFPQREAAARVWLERRGVEAFFPVRCERRVVRGSVLERTSRFLPGYVFARFPSEPAWHLILRSPELPSALVRDVIRTHAGEPGWLLDETLDALKAMRGAAEALNARWHAARALRVGCRARVTSGPFEGVEVEIAEVVTVEGRQRARFPIKMFCGVIAADLDAVMLERIGVDA